MRIFPRLLEQIVSNRFFYILATRGSQMGIFLTMSTLLKTNKNVVVGEASYDATGWAIVYHGGKLVRIPVDGDGLDIAHISKSAVKSKK